MGNGFRAVIEPLHGPIQLHSGFFGVTARHVLFDFFLPVRSIRTCSEYALEQKWTLTGGRHGCRAGLFF